MSMATTVNAAGPPTPQAARPAPDALTDAQRAAFEANVGLAGREAARLLRRSPAWDRDEAWSVALVALLRAVRRHDGRTKLGYYYPRFFLKTEVRDRARAARRGRPPEVVGLDVAPEPADPRPGPAESLEQSDLAARRAEWLWAAVATLEPEVGYALRRVYRDGASTATVAREAGVACTTVHERCRRAIRKLRARVPPELRGPGPP